ncbi:MAG: CapA family protein [Bacteroidales bacterium]
MKLTFIIFLQALITNVFACQNDTLKLLFLGDIMQHQAQLDAARSTKGSSRDSRSYDYSSYFRHLEERFGNADFRIANMETTFAKPPYSGYPSFSSPISLISDSKRAGIDLFLAANNHICDKGERGLSGTLDAYDSLKVLYTGIYRNPQEELIKNPLILELKNFRIAFLNYTYGTNEIYVPQPFVVKLIDTSAIKRDLERTKEICPDFIIVCLHWGEEYRLKHSSGQERIEEFFYKNGTDIIIGSHPHVPQDYRIEYGPDNEIKHITVYSLGNAISNMTAQNTRIGMSAEILLYREKGGTARILPPKFEYIWTSRPNMFDKNFTILPVEEYLEKPELFKDKEDYRNMKRYYLRFNK